MNRNERTPAPGEARRKFLTEGDAGEAVPVDIARSWERSRRSGADPEAFTVPYEPDAVDTCTRFCDAVLPVLRHFAAVLEGTPTCLVLADRDARGIDTWVGDPSLQGALDRIGARPGFRFSEDVAGTNGLGTPLEIGRPISIRIGEHYADALQPLACAGVPVRNPLTRRIEAVIDITCAFDDPNRLLMPLALEIAHQVEDALYRCGSLTEQALLAHFLAASRTSTKGMLVVGPDLVMANGPAALLIDGMPQSLLWEHAARVTRDRRADRRGSGGPSYELEGPDGAVLLVRAAPVTDGDRVIGAVLELEREAGAGRAGPRTAGGGTTTEAPGLPGLAGSSATWKRLCVEARRLAGASGGARLVIAGEAGTGKLSVARAALGDAALVDGALEVATGVGGWIEQLQNRLRGKRPVIVTHLECLSGAAVRAAAAVLDATPDGPAFAATLVLGERPITHCAPMLARLAHLELPPLRRRPEDILDVAAAILARVGPGRRCGPEARKVLTRYTWPGNARQLEMSLRYAVAAHERGDIRVDDLPDEVRRGGSGRSLTRMEQAELDAILVALAGAGGNKVEAAASLGISRSTLYRKLTAFGLDDSVL